ncbi:hypothetical protein AB0J83_07530 [Actinoplanes sp. NPDC049596]|uniref:coiled-coil domain-containing protein n=1 Tax=unclassified Actinoplanes TaxID=2626549 RepID=UPI00344527EB
MTVRPRRWLMLALAPIVSVAFLASPISPAYAEPGDGTSATPDESAGKENQTLDELIESSNRRFVQAKGAVAKSTAAQKALATKIKTAEARRNELIPEVNAIANQQYRFGQLNAASFLLSSKGSDDFLRRAMSLEEINTEHDRKLGELNKAIDEVTKSKVALDAEVKKQQTNLVAMQKQKEAASQALNLVGGEGLTQGHVLAKSPVAKAAPRNSDGGFSPESCTVKDPTTSGCITARTLNMYKEVKKAGFDRFVGCHRDGGPFEHPKGRACDWSLQDSGFAVAHNADMKEYGNNLMAFLVRNADRLGIYYVIWYKQIWFPSEGEWRAYHGPSDHTDHVHVSML